MKIKIKKASKKYLSDIQELSDQLSIYPFPRRFGKEWFEEKDGANKKIKEMIVALDTGAEKVVGYLTFNIGFKNIDIDTLIVSKDYRKKGIGRSLVDYFCNKIAKNIRKKNNNITKITVGSYNCFLAKGFYVKMEFEEIRFSKLERSVMDWHEFKKEI